MASKPSKADGEWSAAADQCATTKVARASASTTTADIQLEAGQYLVFLQGGRAADVVYLAFAATNAGTAAAPAATANNAAATYVTAAAFRGDMAERITVTSAATWVSYILSSGGTTADLIFVKLG